MEISSSKRTFEHHIEYFCPEDGRSEFPFSGMRKMTHALADTISSVVSETDVTDVTSRGEDLAFTSFLQHMCKNQIAAVNLGKDGYLGQYFIDLRAFFSSSWWETNEVLQKQRIAVLLKDYPFILKESNAAAEEKLRSIYNVDQTPNKWDYSYTGFLQHKLYLTGNLEADIKIYFYILFLINSENFVRAYQRTVVDDDFSGKDYGSFEKRCHKFIKEKVLGSNTSHLLQRCAFVPDTVCERSLDGRRESIWLKKQEREFPKQLNATLFRFFVYMTEFFITHSLGAQGKSPEKTKSNADKGKDFELACVQILESKGWSTSLTPSSGDQGADIIAERGPIKLVIQCKDYKGNVGNSAVQEVHAAKSYYDASLAAIVCTKNYTKSAQVLAKNVGVLLLHVSDLENL